MADSLGFSKCRVHKFTTQLNLEARIAFLLNEFDIRTFLHFSVINAIRRKIK